MVIGENKNIKHHFDSHFGYKRSIILQDNRHYFCDEKGRIRCLPGWQNEKKMCKVPDCTVNNRTCVNGNCSSPFICDCNIGW